MTEHEPLTREELANAFDDNRHLWVRSSSMKRITGKTRAYVSDGGSDTFHVDTDCPHFPENKWLEVYAVSQARKAYWLAPCSYCTTGDQ